MRNKIVYGYGIENGRLRIQSGEKEVIRKIFDDYISGNSIRQIMQALNAGGILSPNGRAWSHKAVGKMLKDSRYIGDSLYPVMIPEEIFVQAQEKRQETNKALGRTPKMERDKLPYDGMVFCGRCGRRFYRLHHRGKTYWECGMHHQGKRAKERACSNSRHFVDTEIEKAFIRLQNRMFDGAVEICQPISRNTKRLEALKAKYTEILENSGSYEERSLADVIFWIAAEEYAQSKGAEDKMIQRAIDENGRTMDFQVDVFLKIVRKITVMEDGLCFELINGQKIPNV